MLVEQATQLDADLVEILLQFGQLSLTVLLVGKLLLVRLGLDAADALVRVLFDLVQLRLQLEDYLILLLYLNKYIGKADLKKIIDLLLFDLKLCSYRN